MPRTSRTPRTTRPHPLFARYFAKMAGPAMERAGIAEYRRRTLAGLAGEVVEVGAGNGLNFPHYPPEVTRLTAVEPEPTMRRLAGQRARDGSVAVPVETVDAAAEHLPFPDGTFDAAVVSGVLCSVADPSAALAELHRVLRPGGELRFFEHVRAGTPGLRRAQRVLDATLWPRLMGGCRLGRDSEAAIAAAGFTLATVDRFVFPPSRIPLPNASHILGAAVRDAAVRDSVVRGDG